MHSLADVGMTSLNLTSDGVTRSNGDGVTEAGRSSATLADGSSMAVADAAFTFQSNAVQASTAADGQVHVDLLSDYLTLDLGNLRAVFGKVSEVDLGNVQHNTLNVQLKDVLAQPLEVNGIAGDAVELFTAGESVTSTTTQLHGQTYQAFDLNHDGHMDLLVQQAVMVNMH